ncbi:hypothetical protein HJC23_013026 [Cyclotella cryptica]|uniref:Glycosyltransferase n=1 Tax=Cyclotella cryptica TaxID=29204 RepID=A0ABD3QIG5_9STRA|eukprot:CCRYP_005647-RA/>CCRYP_005647-RA protein AED:0.01 eAED:0.01 QI:274/-1/1/1/-1/1/1/99/435
MRRRQENTTPILVLNDGAVSGYDIGEEKKFGSIRLRNSILLLGLVQLFFLLGVLISSDKIYQFGRASLVMEHEPFHNSAIHSSNKLRQGPIIPRRLIFTYKYNLINPSEDDPPFDPKNPLTANVLNTIEKYKQNWKRIDDLDDANNNHRSAAKNEAVVSFLSNEDCVEIIKRAEPKLIRHFSREKRGDFKADICRIAELYIHGGYYFDADISVVDPVNLDKLPIQRVEISDPFTELSHIDQSSEIAIPSEDDIVTFATVINVQGVFFQAFLAAAPNHPIMKTALQYMLAYYEGKLQDILPRDTLLSLAKYSETIPSRKRPQGIGVGPYTLAAAYLATSHVEWEDFARKLLREGALSSDNASSGRKKKMHYSRFLYEVSLTSKHVTERELFQDVPLQSHKKSKYGDGDWCNFICFGGRKVYFYARVVGSRGCPKAG